MTILGSLVEAGNPNLGEDYVKCVFISLAEGPTPYKITVDSRTFEEFEVYDPGRQFFGVALLGHEKIGLVDKRTNKPQPLPYLLFDVESRYSPPKNKGQQPNPVFITITCRGKNPSTRAKDDFQYKYINEKTEHTPETKEVLLIKLDPDYKLKGVPFVDYYTRMGLLKQGATKREFEVTSKLFNDVCSSFISSITNSLHSLNVRKVRFKLAVLPLSTNPKPGDITYKTEKINTVSGLDAFEKPIDRWETRALEGSDMKFFSDFDFSYVLNFMSRPALYEALGIGKNSYERINIPQSGKFMVSGITWVVFRTDSKTVELRKKTGFYESIHSILEERGKDQDLRELEKNSRLHILALAGSKAHRDVIFYENFTINELKKRFEPRKVVNPPALGLEVLISDKEWNLYLKAVAAVLFGTTLSRELVVGTLTKKIKGQIRECLESPTLQNNDIANAFTCGDFCIQVLCKPYKPSNEGCLMTPAEDFAYKTGQIAHDYISFKRSHKDINNSLNAILSYPVYDKLHLMEVLKRVGNGIALAADLDGIENFEEDIRKKWPDGELPDGNTDYSYFFYKGVFGK